MNILQICNDFSGSKVHCNLARELDALGVKQTVYCPVREKHLLGKNQFEGKNIEFKYSLCIKSWYKYLYHFKAWKLYRDMKSNVELRKIDMIHAHTLFSDGYLAYKAYKEFGIKYSVAVRNTDLNVFARFLRHTHSTGRKILQNAENVYFISAGIKKQFEMSRLLSPIFEQVKNKFVIQPNGIEDYWHNNISHETRSGKDVLYVGDFSANKNVVRLAEAILQLRKNKGFEDVRLIIVGGEVKGGGRKNDGKTRHMIDNNPDAIKALGKIYDKDKLSEVMQSCSLFAMPSIFETFGLVYLEALSQNLPVIFTKGQGIDGMFDHTIGIGVNPLSVEEIMEAIKEIILNHDAFNNKNVNFSDFQWTNIANRYMSNYKHIINA